MKIKILPLSLIFVFIFIFIVFYKGLHNSNIYTPSTTLEKSVPNIKVKLFLTDEEMNFNKIFIGNKFYLMNIWSSWCVPCRDEHEFLIKLSEFNQLDIIGLNYKDDEKKAKNFLKQLGSPYSKIISDKNGLIAIEWGAYGVPETFLIHNKKILKKIIGPIDHNSYLEIRKLIR